MTISLDGKTAIVTSAAQDVGRTIAQRFLDAGAKVMLADSDDKALAHAEDDMDGDRGRFDRFHFTAQDKLSIQNLIAATIDRFERIDILVNSAQAICAPGSFLELAPGEFDSHFGDNVRGVFQLSQAVAKRMVAQGEKEETPSGGSIVNISSVSGQRTVPELLTFSVSTAALDQLTRSMAAALAPRGIRVNAIALGGVLTERLRSAFSDDESLRDEMIRVTPMGRVAEMEEVAEAAIFVASEQASYITGQILSVDGGRTLLDPLASPVR